MLLAVLGAKLLPNEQEFWHIDAMLGPNEHANDADEIVLRTCFAVLHELDLVGFLRL
jgi:hypothetical protein